MSNFPKDIKPQFAKNYKMKPATPPKVSKEDISEMVKLIKENKELEKK